MSLDDLVKHLASVARALAKAVGGDIADEMRALADEIDPPTPQPSPEPTPEPTPNPAPPDVPAA